MYNKTIRGEKLMDLLNKTVNHITYGTGTVVELTKDTVKIEFAEGVKSFLFPEGFEKHLTCLDDKIQKEILDLLSEKQRQKAEREQKEEQARTAKVNPNKTALPKKKTYTKKNIAFKCNYCDGGKDKNGIGFLCACSDDVINYNVNTAKHNWCCNGESFCKQYVENEISRKDLDANSKGDAFVCYESQMLRNWKAFAGYALTKENKNKPLKLNYVQVNSLAMLTTRLPGEPEKDRFIFGVFLVDEAYEGDNREEGYVTTNSKYKLSLSLDEAKRIRFWNYYKNETAPDRIAWGQGLHRYVKDEQAASILRDIAELKKGTPDEELSKEFFEHFCKINSLSVD